MPLLLTAFAIYTIGVGFVFTFMQAAKDDQP